MDNAYLKVWLCSACGHATLIGKDVELTEETPCPTCRTITTLAVVGAVLVETEIVG